MNFKDFEKLSTVKERSVEGGLKKKAFANYLGKAMNAYFVGSAPFTFNQTLRKAKKIHAVPAATY